MLCARSIEQRISQQPHKSSSPRTHATGLIKPRQGFLCVRSGHRFALPPVTWAPSRHLLWVSLRPASGPGVAGLASDGVCGDPGTMVPGTGSGVLQSAHTHRGRQNAQDTMECVCVCVCVSANNRTSSAQGAPHPHAPGQGSSQLRDPRPPQSPCSRPWRSLGTSPQSEGVPTVLTPSSLPLAAMPHPPPIPTHHSNLRGLSRGNQVHVRSLAGSPVQDDLCPHKVESLETHPRTQDPVGSGLLTPRTQARNGRSEGSKPDDTPMSDSGLPNGETTNFYCSRCLVCVARCYGNLRKRRGTFRYKICFLGDLDRHRWYPE